MRNIYFLKMNLESKKNDIYSSKKDILNNELNIIYDLLTNSEILSEGMTYKYIRKVNNVEHEEKIDFFLNLLKKDDNRKIIMGDFRKTTPIKYNIEDENKELKTIVRDSIEGIRFVFDIKNEYLCFYTSNRFGYNQFKKYFAMYINHILNDFRKTKDIKYIDFIFVKSNLGLEEFYKQLQELGKIKKLSLDLTLPNPSEEHKKKLLESLKNKDIDPKEVGVNQVTTILESKDEEGINVESDVILNEISTYNDVNVMFKDEGTEETNAVLNYFKAEAENFQGQVIKSEKNEKYINKLKKEDTYEGPFWNKGIQLIEKLISSERS